MIKAAHILVFGLIVLLAPVCTEAEESNSMARLSMESSKAPIAKSKVTAVYGISADDYLPTTESARKHLRPKVRSRKSRPSLDLPDAFYFIGGPIFLFLFLRVLVIFLNGFEEKRKEELRTVSREVWDAE